MSDTALVRVESQMRALAIPKDADAIWGIAESMHKVGLVPTSIKSVECAFLAMMKGAEYGLLPQQALAGFYVIGNIAHPYGTCLNGIVKAAASYVDEIEGCVEGLGEMRYLASEENQYKPGSTRHAMFAELQRELKRRLARVEERIGKTNAKGEPKEPPSYFCGWSVMVRKDCDPVCMLFDSFDAQRGELLGKGMWGKWPTRMHMHRAATFNRRDTFGDALMGLEATYEEIMDNAVDLGTQPAPAAATNGGPTAVLRDLSQPRQPTSARHSTVEAKASTATASPAREAPTPPASGAAKADIYAGMGNPAPTSDIPDDPEVSLAPDEKRMAQAPGSQPSAPPAQSGTAALKAAVEQVLAAGLDAAAIGKEAVEAMMGVGVQTKDLSDSEKGNLARAMLGKLEALQGRQPGDEPDEAEF